MTQNFKLCMIIHYLSTIALIIDSKFYLHKDAHFTNTFTNTRTRKFFSSRNDSFTLTKNLYAIKSTEDLL